ncbi:MAG: type II toxin-antitoxin system VapB family antitoxin [Bauldia sp.]
MEVERRLMGINIKNREAERLIRELAGTTGEGQTEAVTVAVRERLERVNAGKAKQKRLERMRQIIDEVAPLLQDMPDIESYLYDEKTGLPK